jgi:hypothetical protein
MQEPPRLTKLQEIILETDALGLTVRDSIRQVSARVGFFVGQHTYVEQLQRAQEIVEQQELQQEQQQEQQKVVTQ